MINPIGLILTVGLYKGVEFIQKTNHNKFIKNVLSLPTVFIAGLMLIFILKIFHIKFETYNETGHWITLMLIPATIALGYPIYKYKNLLKKNKRIIYSSFILATIFSITITYAIASFCHANYELIISMLPKSVTAPIAVEISRKLGGIPELTACIVVLTGVCGAIIGHKLLKLIKVKSDVAIGLSIGTASHVIGTASCAEKGKDKQVVMASLAFVMIGILTAIFAPIFLWLIKCKLL